MFSSRCASEDVPGMAQHCSFSPTPLLPNECKRHARARATLVFIWLWPPVELLVLCNRYGFTIAVRSLGKFQRASEAPAPKAFGAGRGSDAEIRPKNRGPESWI